MKRDLRRVWSWLLVGAVSLGGSWVYAEEAAPPQTKPADAAPDEAPKEEQPRPERSREGRRGRGRNNGENNNNGAGDSARQFLERFGRFRALDKHEREHETVKTAFRDVVSAPHKSTVRVLSNDKNACLGTIVDAEGYIVTKASEAQGKLSVKLHDNRLYDATLIGVDPKNDVAMLKIEAKDLPTIAWRDANDVPTVGSFLATSGLETLPVAIGVVSVQPRFIAGPRGVLGVMLSQQDGQPGIERVFDDSGAQAAGVKPGDVIVGINGQPVASREELIETIGKFEIEDKVTLKIKRGTEDLELAVRLKARPQSMEMPSDQRKDFQNMLGGPLSERRLGFRLALQHDTVLTPQDCGGPLVDLDGRAVGINIARAGRVNSYALPVSVMLPLVEEMKSGKFAPDPPAVEAKQSLAQRLEALKQSESNLGMKLAELVSSIQKLQETLDAEQLKKAEQEKAATETELGKIKAELEKIQQEKTSLEK